MDPLGNTKYPSSEPKERITTERQKERAKDRRGNRKETTQERAKEPEKQSNNKK